MQMPDLFSSIKRYACRVLRSLIPIIRLIFRSDFMPTLMLKVKRSIANLNIRSLVTENSSVLIYLLFIYYK